VELVQHPDQLELLRRDPSLTERAVEELLRFNPRTVIGFLKRATVDMEVGGTTIRAGDQVSLSLSAANRDPEAFVDPDRLDITRTDNKHLAFGAGAHFCMGANLARTEAQIAIGTLVRRFPHVQLDEAAMARKPIPSNDWDRVPVACS
jgi:cytochrome P450